MLPVLKSDHPNLVKSRRHSTPANMKPKSQSLSEGTRNPRLSISLAPETKRQKSKSVCAQLSPMSEITAMTKVRTPKGLNNNSRQTKLYCQMEMNVRKPSVTQATSLSTASPTIVIEPAFSLQEEQQVSQSRLRAESSDRRFSLSSSPKAFANFWTLIARQAATTSGHDAFNRG